MDDKLERIEKIEADIEWLKRQEKERKDKERGENFADFMNRP